MSEDTELEVEEFRCWCGAVGTFEEMFSDDTDRSCGGLGELNCYCGGDFCICHNHGTTECDGCPDCENDDGETDEWY